MRLLDLDPRWIMRDGKRIGFTFISPMQREFRQSCFAVATPSREQWDLFEEMHGDDGVQGCRPDFAWTILGGIDTADFATISVKPSIDGSPGGTWHGYITNGEIVGEI